MNKTVTLGATGITTNKNGFGALPIQRISMEDAGKLLLRRSPSELQLTPEVQAKMKKIEDCIHCGQCSAHCPYRLDTPKLLEENYKDYMEVLNGKPL